MALGSLARARRILDKASPRKPEDRIDLLLAIDQLLADTSVDYSTTDALLSLRENLVDEARAHDQLTTEMHAARDREAYDAVRDSETETEDNQDSER